MQTNSISDMSSEGGAGDFGEESDETTASDVDSPSDDDVMTEESVEQPLQCEILGREFTDDFFPQVSDLEKLARSQKRRMRRKRGLTRAKDRLASKWQDQILNSRFHKQLYANYRRLMSHCQPCGPLQMTRRTQLSSGIRAFCIALVGMENNGSTR